MLTSQSNFSFGRTLADSSLFTCDSIGDYLEQDPGQARQGCQGPRSYRFPWWCHPGSRRVHGRLDPFDRPKRKGSRQGEAEGIRGEAGGEESTFILCMNSNLLTIRSFPSTPFALLPLPTPPQLGNHDNLVS